jgi:hypothetical protein
MRYITYMQTRETALFYTTATLYNLTDVCILQSMETKKEEQIGW